MWRASLGLLWLGLFLGGATTSAGQTTTRVVRLEGLEGAGARSGVYRATASLWTEEVGGDLVWEEYLGVLSIGAGDLAAPLELGSANALPADFADLWLEITSEGAPLGPRMRMAPDGDVVIDDTLAVSFRVSFGDGLPDEGRIQHGFDGDLEILNFAGGEVSVWTSLMAGGAAGQALVVEPTGRVLMKLGTDAEPTDGSGYLMIGLEGGENLLLDNNELMARDDGATSTLFLQNSGGAVFVNGMQVHASDGRLKRDVRELEVGLNDVLALNPVSFAWKRGDGRRHYGLIAQEVEELSEHLILEDEKGYKGVAYMELVPLLIRALQEQEERIRRLEAELGRPRSEVPLD